MGAEQHSTDADIVAASLENPREFEQLFDRHYQAIHRYAVRRAGRELGSDIASETFVEAFQSRQRYDLDYPSARPWLFGIAHNVLRSELRRVSVRRRNPGHLERPSDSHESDVVWRADAESLVQRSGLAAEISGLSSGDREVLFLYALGELTYREIAEALDIPIGTVRSRLARVRSQLRPCLEAVRGDER